MATNNPIDCVSLMIHDEHITIWIHRGDTLNSYSVIKDHGKEDKPLRFHRMVKVFTETLKVTYLQVTGNLAPAKW